MTAVHSLFHRGFGLYVETCALTGGRTAFRYALTEDDVRLCASEPTYRTVASAERAARRHIDDAVQAYEWATARLAVA